MNRPIVADTSAIVAIALGEPEREIFLDRILSAEKVLISTVNVLETRLVIHGRRGQRGVVLIDDFLALSIFEHVPPAGAELAAAYSAFVAYGKGSGHPAALNFGDLFSYALAKVRDLPLLFKGEDFALTDIPAAHPS